MCICTKVSEVFERFSQAIVREAHPNSSECLLVGIKSQRKLEKNPKQMIANAPDIFQAQQFVRKYFQAE